MKFRKYFFIIFPVLLFLFSFQKIDNDSIEWSKDRPLVWKDFKGTLSNKEKFAALTAWSIYFTADPLGTDSIDAKVVCLFLKADSKVKREGRKDSLLLVHEQYHFNLAEVYTRKFRKAMEEAIFTQADVVAKTKKLYKQYFSDCSKEQDLYDKETEHSLKTEQQLQWQVKIDSDLEEFSQYTWKDKKLVCPAK